MVLRWPTCLHRFRCRSGSAWPRPPGPWSARSTKLSPPGRHPAGLADPAQPQGAQARQPARTGRGGRGARGHADPSPERDGRPRADHPDPATRRTAGSQVVTLTEAGEAASSACARPRWPSTRPAHGPGRRRPGHPRHPARPPVGQRRRGPSRHPLDRPGRPPLTTPTPEHKHIMHQADFHFYLIGSPMRPQPDPRLRPSHRPSRARVMATNRTRRSSSVHSR